jgi:O-antigen/teichoic acid export membrane protein
MLNSISGNTITQLLGKATSTLIGLVVVALMTRALGAAGFGEYTTVVAYLQFFGILVDFGLTMTTARELGNARLASNILLGNLLSFRTVTAGAAFIIAPLVALFLPYPPLIKTGIALTSLAFFLSSLSQSFGAVFQAQLKSHLLILAELGGRIVLLVGTIFATLGQLPLISYLLILIASSLTTTTWTLVAAKRLLPFKWQINLAVWRELWHATWPIALTIAINLIYFKADTLILSLLKPTIDVGLYGAAYKVLEVLLAVPAIVCGLVLPLAARAYAQGDKNKLAELYHGTFDSMLAAGLAVLVGGIIIGTPLMTLFAGAEFAVTGKILAILGVATAFIFLGNAIGYFIFALDKVKKMIPAYLITALVALTGYFIFIPTYSYWGAAWMTVVAEALMTTISLVILWKLGLKPSTVRWPKIILATLFFATILMMPLPLIPKLILGAVVYLVTVWYLKLIPKDIVGKNSAETLT